VISFRIKLIVQPFDDAEAYSGVVILVNIPPADKR
jgi:hypothetical protein